MHPWRPAGRRLTAGEAADARSTGRRCARVGLRPPLPGANCGCTWRRSPPRRGRGAARRGCSGGSSTTPSRLATCAEVNLLFFAAVGPGPGRDRAAAAQPLLRRPHRRGPHLRHAGRAVRPRAAHAAGVLHPHADRQPAQPHVDRRGRRTGDDHHAGHGDVRRLPARRRAVVDVLRSAGRSRWPR